MKAEKRGKPKRPEKIEDIPIPDSQNLFTNVNIPRAYALIPAKTSGGVPAWHLLKIEVRDGLVISVDKSVENLRGVHLQGIEDDIMRDA